MSENASVWNGFRQAKIKKKRYKEIYRELSRKQKEITDFSHAFCLHTILKSIIVPIVVSTQFERVLTAPEDQNRRKLNNDRETFG